MPASEFSDVFISYRRKDVEFTKRLVEDLNKDGKEVWVDWEDIPPGVEGFTDEIKRGLEGADIFLAVLSPDYLESTYCVDMELGYAIEMNKKIIPIVIEKFEDYDIPQGIGHINWIYFTPHAGQDNTYEQSYPKILDVMHSDLEHVRNHKRFLYRAIEWNKNNRTRSYLLTGEEIEHAQDWLTNAVGKEPVPTDLHKAYVSGSVKNKQRQQRLLLSGVTVALVVSIVLSILFLISRNIAERQADEAQSVALISNAQLIHPDDPTLALALAQEAVSIEDPPVLVQRAYADIAYNPGLVIQQELSPSKHIFAMKYTEDGQIIFALTLPSSISYTPDMNTNLPQELSLLEVDAWNANTVEPIIPTEDEIIFYKAQLMDTILDAEELGEVDEINELVERKRSDGGSIVAMSSPDNSYLALGSFFHFGLQEIIIVGYDGSSYNLLRQQTVPVGVTAIAFTADNKWVAFGFVDGSILLLSNRELSTTSASIGTGVPRRISNMTFSPDGRYLTIAFNNSLFDNFSNTLEIWDMAYGAEIFHREGLSNSPRPLIHPDNRTVYIPHGTRPWIDEYVTIDALDVQTDELTPYLDSQIPLLGSVLWYSNWELRFDTEGNTVDLREIATDAVLQTIFGSGQDLPGFRVHFTRDGESAVSFTPDSESVLNNACYYSGESMERPCTGDVIVWDLETGSIKYKYVGISNFQSNFAFTITLDNTNLVYTSLDDNQQLLTVFMDMETGEIAQTLPVAGHDIYFLSDTEMVVTSDTDTSLWNYQTGKLTRHYAGGGAILTPENQLITMDDNRVIIWNGEQQARIITMSNPASNLSLSNDGKTLIIMTSVGVTGSSAVYQDVYVFRVDTLDEIQQWVAENRLMHTLTCNERLAYHVIPYCNDVDGIEDRAREH